MGNRKLKPPACFAAVRRGKPAFAPSAMATVDPRCALAAPGKADLSLRSHRVGEGAKKSEKCEKSVFAVFQLEPAAAQSLPTKMACGDFSDFSKIFRGYTGGRGSREKLCDWVCTKWTNCSLIMAVERRNYRLLPHINAYYRIFRKRAAKPYVRLG